ncbi:MAG: outer membrane protein assembly factor [Flavobacteriales bacterium]
MLRTYTFLSILLLSAVASTAQERVDSIDLSEPKEYEIGGVTITGAIFSNQDALKAIAELRPGLKIMVPGVAITSAIKKLWDQRMFSNIDIRYTKITGNIIYLDILVEERNQLGGKVPEGDFKKKEFEKLKDDLEEAFLYRGVTLTPEIINRTKRFIIGHFRDNGYYNVKVDIELQPDPMGNNTQEMHIKLTKGPKVKIKDIILEGNVSLSNPQIYRLMKETKRKKWWRMWKKSKFMDSDYKADKQKIIDKLNDMGLRDAFIEFDSTWMADARHKMIKIRINEGKKYYIRHITWLGNGKYRSSYLDSALGIKRGDLYHKSDLDARLYMSQAGNDITSLYMNFGYLFFNINPVEIRVEGDSIDFEMRISEGRQARYKDIRIYGNDKTSDWVLLREIRTRPGDMFNREDIIRTQRELSQLPYVNPEKIGINPIPNPADGTVDIEYTIEEKASDQVNLSAGWGGGRLIGTLGLTINNFAANKVLNGRAWTPIPSGNGQQLSISAQSTGAFYQGYNLSFVEPWLGGKKPNSLSVNGYHTFSSNDTKKRSDETKSKLMIYGGSVGLGKRLKWPDDYFTIYHELTYQYYVLNNYFGVFTFSNGFVNNVSYRYSLSRNSIDAPIYPRSGSNLTFTAKMTLPYSFFNKKDYSGLSDQERFRMLEYFKLKFTTSHFLPITKDRKLVLNVRTGVGILQPWNKKVGNPPFERFVMGGSGLTGVNFFFGREIIAFRGYNDGEVSSNFGDFIIAKYTAELRYPLSLNPSATIYLLTFADAGKTWNSLRSFNPFDVYRSGGVGVRLFMPMFGILGLDYGWRLDNVPGRFMAKGQFHFTIGMNLGEL